MLVVRPQPGQAVTVGVKLRKPKDCKISEPTNTSCVLDSLGAGVKETLIVSPIPSCNKRDKAAVEATIPLTPIPASVRPKCKG